MDDVGLMTERIDAHHHVWDLAVRDQPWMTGDGVDPLRRSFGIDEFVTQAQANGVGASVVVQAVADISETEELLDLAAATPEVAGVVGLGRSRRGRCRRATRSVVGEAVGALAGRDPQSCAI